MSVFTNPTGSSAHDIRAYTEALLELLGARQPLEVLERTPSLLRQRLAGVPAGQLAIPEAPGKWSVRQVLQHLADSELVGGFRFRMILAHDRPPLVGYDQDLWAARLHYERADPQVALNEFETLRRANVRLLTGLPPEDLQRVGVHAERGDESVDRLLKLYAGHDLLHLRQVDRILTAAPA
jgi:hypothetical protein